MVDKRRFSDYTNGKAHRLLPGNQKPGDRSSRRKSKSSTFSRRRPGEPERFEVTITGAAVENVFSRSVWKKARIEALLKLVFSRPFPFVLVARPSKQGLSVKIHG
jgi:hypothetical protein